MCSMRPSRVGRKNSVHIPGMHAFYRATNRQLFDKKTVKISELILKCCEGLA